VTAFGQVNCVITNQRHPDQLSLANPPCVGAMSTGDDYGHRWGRTWWVLRSSRPCDQDCWYTDLVG